VPLLCATLIIAASHFTFWPSPGKGLEEGERRELGWLYQREAIRL